MVFCAVRYGFSIKRDLALVRTRGRGMVAYGMAALNRPGTELAFI